MSPIGMTVLLLVGLGLFARTMNERIRILLALKPDDRFDHPQDRTDALVQFGFGQKRLLDREEIRAGILHAIIFAGFVILNVNEVTLFARGYSHDFVLPGCRSRGFRVSWRSSPRTSWRCW